MRDNFKLVARIPYPVTVPKSYVLASEVATMDSLCSSVRPLEFLLPLSWIPRSPLDSFCLSIHSPGLSRIPLVPSSSFHWSLQFFHMFLQFLLRIPNFLLPPCCFVCSVLEIIRSIRRSNGIILEAQGVFQNYHIKQCHVYYVFLSL